MVKVSILIPIYNAEKWLRQCMDSIINQTLDEIEIICINDGSKDSSLKIINEYQKNDSRIKVVNKVNTGYGHTLNQGIKIAKGEYIGIVESDDFIDSNMFEALYNAAKDQQVDVVKSNYYQYYTGKDIFTPLYEAYPYNIIFNPNEYTSIFEYPCLWTAIYRREFLLRKKIFFNETPGASFQDISFTFKALASTERLLILKDAFYHYRMDNDMSSVHIGGKVYCCCDEFEEIERFLQENPKIKNRLIYVARNLKYVHYRWNYMRIYPEEKIPFLKRVIQEVELDAGNHTLVKTYFADVLWNEIQEILNNKNAFLCSAYIDIQRERFCIRGFLECVAKYKYIYIFGAGKIGKLVKRFLTQQSIEINGFLVTDIAHNDIEIDGVKVNEIDKIKCASENTLVVIAVKIADQYDVLGKTNARGIKDIVIIDDYLKNAMSVYQ